MKNYIGTYRVVCEFDRATLEPIKEDTYITCAKGGQIYRYDDNTLVYYRPTRGNSNQYTEKLALLGVKGLMNCSSDWDMVIYFNEESINIVAEEFGAITSGASISPYSIKNLRKLDWFKRDKQKFIDKGLYKELSDEEKQIYRDRFNRKIS